MFQVSQLVLLKSIFSACRTPRNEACVTTHGVTIFCSCDTRFYFRRVAYHHPSRHAARSVLRALLGIATESAKRGGRGPKKCGERGVSPASFFFLNRSS